MVFTQIGGKEKYLNGLAIPQPVSLRAIFYFYILLYDIRLCCRVNGWHSICRPYRSHLRFRLHLRVLRHQVQLVPQIFVPSLLEDRRVYYSFYILYIHINIYATPVKSFDGCNYRSHYQKCARVIRGLDKIAYLYYRGRFIAIFSYAVSSVTFILWLQISQINTWTIFNK